MSYFRQNNGAKCSLMYELFLSQKMPRDKCEISEIN